MLIYKQRYKPRTSRAFTKSDLTVYDSADNTALNTLTVYGKSEVINNEIVSAGEGWATADLGTLNYTYNSTYNVFITSDIDYALSDVMLCAEYEYRQNTQSWSQLQNKQFAAPYGIQIAFKNTDYTDPTAFKTAMSGVMLAYELADPTQGNCIAIKTDDGTGINGTMAVFETGTPLYGIPDTDVRDVMQWDGSAGTVTKYTRKIIIDNNSNVILWDEGGAGAFYVGITISQQQIKPPTDNDTPFNGLSNVPIMSRNALINSQIVAIASNLTGINILIKIPSVTTVEDAKTYLQNNPITLIYELATPTTQTLTTNENASIAELRTFEPQTHAQNNAQTEMTVDYTIRVPTS